MQRNREYRAVSAPQPGRQTDIGSFRLASCGSPRFAVTLICNPRLANAIWDYFYDKSNCLDTPHASVNRIIDTMLEFR
jgi:hypothetical protein